VLDVIEILSPATPSDAKAVSRTRLGKMLPTIIAFAAGAIVGALAYRRVGFWALLVPFAVLVWLAFNARGGMEGAAHATTSATAENARK
jgi:uncharacterized membrane protein YoaK (UPF0700 family)